MRVRSSTETGAAILLQDNLSGQFHQRPEHVFVSDQGRVVRVGAHQTMEKGSQGRKTGVQQDVTGYGEP